MESYSPSDLRIAAGRVLTVSKLWIVLFTLSWAIVGGTIGYGFGTMFKVARQQVPPSPGLHVDPAFFQFAFAFGGVVIVGVIAYMIAAYLAAFLKMIVQVSLCVGQIEANLRAKVPHSHER